MNRKAFFDSIKSMFVGGYTQSQVDTLDAILNEGEKRGVPLKHLAYILATVYHEVGSKLEPISENLNYSAKRLTEVWPSRFPTLASAQPFANNPERLGNKVYGGRLGNSSTEGYKYRGRGFSQITGKVNYEKFAKILNVDLVNNPSLAMEKKHAIAILFEGMINGLFTGKRLSDYEGYTSMRAIINADGKTNGAKIAGYATRFEKALAAGAYNGKAVVQEPEVAPEPNVTPVTKTFGELVVAFFKALFGVK